MSRSTRSSSTARPGRRLWPHRLVAVTLVLSGGAVMGYPVVETFLNNERGSQATSAYVDAVSGASNETLRDGLTRAHAYNDNLAQGALYDPWDGQPPGSSPSLGDYRRNLGAFDALARVRIPQIHVDLPVFHDTTKAVLDRGAGHMYGTDLPVGGAGTHAVIAAHTGMKARTFFDRLPELQRGETFLIDVYGETLTYRVDQILIVEPWELEAVQRVPGADHVTLVTCYTPPGKHQMRLLVRGARVPTAPTAALPGQDPAAGTEAPTDAASAESPDDAARTGAVVPVRVDTSVQDWMWPRIGITGGALIVVAVMGSTWAVSDRREGRRQARAATEEKARAQARAEAYAWARAQTRAPSTHPYAAAPWAEEAPPAQPGVRPCDRPAHTSAEALR